MDIAETRSISEDAFRRLREWANAARLRVQSNRTDLPSTKPLRETLLPEDHPRCSIIEAGIGYHMHKSRRRLLVGFKTRDWPDHATSFRYVLPVHFAVLRTMELVPGVRLFLSGDRNLARDLLRGVKRPQNQLIYDMKLSAPKAKGRRAIDIKVDRILFNVDGRTSIYARRTGDHHHIVPEGSVPITTRVRKQPLWDQRAILRAVGELIARNRRGECPVAAEAIKELLEDLFTIADELHWSELIDRRPEDMLYDRGSVLGQNIRSSIVRFVEEKLSRRTAVGETEGLLPG
jgi:hypothetical protein